MRRTIASVVRGKAPKDDDIGIWAAREITPALREIQDHLNGEYTGEYTHTTTLTAAFETIWTSDTVPGDAAWPVSCRIDARATDGSVGVYWILGAFKRTASGALSQVGATASIITPIEDVAGWDVQFALSGNTVLAQVKGDATRTVNWWANPSYRERV